MSTSERVIAFCATTGKESDADGWIEDRVAQFRRHLQEEMEKYCFIPGVRDLIPAELTCGFCGVQSCKANRMVQTGLMGRPWWLCICDDCVKAAQEALDHHASAPGPEQGSGRAGTR